MRGTEVDKQRLVTICRGTGCESSRSEQVQAMMEAEVARLELPLQIKRTGCHGLCERGPIVTVEPEGILYLKVQPDDVADIIASLRNGFWVERLVYHHPISGESIPYYRDLDFYRKQTRLVLRHNGRIDPESIEDYLAVGGYQALRRVLCEMTPEQVIAEIMRSGLRGRGGAGFPTGRKWEEGRRATGYPKFIVANGDEGDPGAFMNRSLMEGDPHAVLEGMAIAGYAVGSDRGYIYVRAEYPLAVKRLSIAIEQARQHGFLGRNILGSSFSFDITIKRGAGAFVCGESTALMYSIEGKRGMPRSRPPHSVEKGLWGKPTVLNNVETLANVPLIITQGADWFASFGTDTSKGTKTFALTGKVKNTGLVEVPMGITLGEIIFDIGGGIVGDKKFKAAQTGGPSGGCVFTAHLDLKLDYESLKAVGSMMGSGGLVIMDEDTCMVDVARFFTHFNEDESCGKCSTCRLGTQRMGEILDRICAGEGRPDDIETLETLGHLMKKTTLCGLGQTAPNPVLSTIRYFREEYEAHIFEKRCPALVCKALIRYRIVPEACTGCTVCARQCPVSAISGARKEPHVIDQALCVKCGGCLAACKFGAVMVE